jgi:hypothetical protein
MNKTTTGLWLCTDDIVRLEGEPTADQIGDCLLKSMARTQIEVPHPSFKGGSGWLVQPLVKAAKRRSYRSFVRDTTLVDVQRDDDVITISPTRNDGPIGPDRGFSSLPELTVSCAPEDVGRVALAGLANAIPFPG